MTKKKAVLVVDDNNINRRVLRRILEPEYTVLEAADGQQALRMLEEAAPVGCMLLDLVMPQMDGMALLSYLQKNRLYPGLPIIVLTGTDDKQIEKTVLATGAWDFIYKPYDPELVLFRVRGAIERSRQSALEQLRYLSRYDALTGAPNRETFFSEAGHMMRQHPEERFVLVRFDIGRFKLINSFFGATEGDRLLCFIADTLEEKKKEIPLFVYGRMEADVFAFCTAYYGRETLIPYLDDSQHLLDQYNLPFQIKANCGVFEVEDSALPVAQMLDCATLAARTIKDSVVKGYSFYTEKMGDALATEQMLLNDFSRALREEEFILEIQPKFDLRTGAPAGGEALVRWQHHERGRISPGDFIPIFEKNGLITPLDEYVWDKTCAHLRAWLDAGKNPSPVSVNMSRVDLFSPQIVDTITNILKKYDLPPELLQLEITESAYADNPVLMRRLVEQLRARGFSVLMDDFGSGYSSLNILKDLQVDYLKIDMRFLAESIQAGRGESILASVVQLAKALDLPCIAEGAEKKKQVDFLRSIGCDYVQGYYFSRPLAVETYHSLDHERQVRVVPVQYAPAALRRAARRPGRHAARCAGCMRRGSTRR